MPTEIERINLSNTRTFHWPRSLIDMCDRIEIAGDTFDGEIVRKIRQDVCVFFAMMKII